MNGAGGQAIQEAVMAFQAFYGLGQSGQLDSQTVREIEAPRCTVRDMVQVV